MKKYLLVLNILFFAFFTYSQNYWQEVYSSNYINQSSLNVSAAGNIFLVADSFLVRSTDNGFSWTNINELEQGYGGAVGVSPTGAVYFLTDTLYTSLDEGNTWSAVTGTLPFYLPWYILCNSDGDLFTELGSLGGNSAYRSTDEGVTWQNISMNSFSLEDIVFKDNLTFGAFANLGQPGNSSLLHSSNNGDNWSQLPNAPNDIFSLHVSQAGWLIGARRYILFNPPSGFLFRSMDNGVTWDTLGINDLLKPIYDIVENQLGHLFVAVDSMGVYRSIDNGVSWQSINTGLNPITVYKLAVDSLGFLYTVADNKLYRSVESTIPVELFSFTAHASDYEVLLNWITATETNNKGFEIQKYKGQSGKYKVKNEDWDVIGFIKGKGTTTEKQFYSFVDDNVKPGKYSYRLKQIDYDGSFEYSKEIEVEIGMPKEFALFQNYPNPFNPTTRIKFTISDFGFTSLKIYDVLGNEIAALINEEKQPGEYEIDFDGSKLSSGVYFYQLRAGSYVQTKKMILLQ